MLDLVDQSHRVDAGGWPVAFLANARNARPDPIGIEVCHIGLRVCEGWLARAADIFVSDLDTERTRQIADADRCRLGVREGGEEEEKG